MTQEAASSCLGILQPVSCGVFEALAGRGDCERAALDLVPNQGTGFD